MMGCNPPANNSCVELFECRGISSTAALPDQAAIARLK